MLGIYFDCWPILYLPLGRHQRFGQIFAQFVSLTLPLVELFNKGHKSLSKLEINITKFWDIHQRLENTSLKSALHLILSLQKDAVISDIINIPNSGDWPLMFRRRLFIWEEELLSNLQLKLRNFTIDVVDLIFNDWSGVPKCEKRKAWQPLWT